MTIRNLPASYASRVLTIAILISLASNQAQALSSTALPGNDKYSLLSTVQAMHKGKCSASGPDITVFEVGGGDPAMNGAFIYLRIDHNENSLVWKTGLNVRTIKKISFALGNTILIQAEEDFMDSKSAIKSRIAAYKILFFLDGDTLKNSLTIEKNGLSTGK